MLCLCKGLWNRPCTASPCRLSLASSVIPLSWICHSAAGPLRKEGYEHHGEQTEVMFPDKMLFLLLPSDPLPYHRNVSLLKLSATTIAVKPEQEESQIKAFGENIWNQVSLSHLHMGKYIPLLVEELIESHDSGNVASHRQSSLHLLSWGDDDPFFLQVNFTPR